MDTKFTIKNFANIKIYLNVKTCFIDFPKHQSGEFIFNLNYNDS